MRKILLSGIVVMIFLAYCYHQRHEATAALQAASSASAGKTTSSTQSSSQSSGSQHPAAPSPAPSASQAGKYKNGTYTGAVADAFYGNVQVQAVVQNGKIAQVNFLQYPNDSRTSQMINSQAVPMLAAEAVKAQTAHVDMITGATQTSSAFVQSLTSALTHAS